VFAVRQAPVLVANLRAAVTGAPLRPYRPQRDYLKLISLGGQSALAIKWGLSLAAPALWRVKDRIDRAFMIRLSDLPAMAVPDAAEPPRCAGCGAKVGRVALTSALSNLPQTTRPDVANLPGDDAAIITLGGARQVITTDHLSAVTEDPVMMTRIACAHALGDIHAMGAAPQAATLSLILPRMSDNLTRRTLAEVMQTAHETLTQAGAAIAGGHTTQGAEFTIGLTLTGLLTKDPITIGGARPGDVLILTKPIGSGTILAAQMRGLAPAPIIASCLQHMMRDQGRAAAILAHAHAMTDVTGFGLAGHLANLCQASGCAADLRLADIPLMDGALRLSQSDVRSSLWPANRDGAGAVLGADGAQGALLFDPQTGGGLLAAVDADQAPGLVQDLRDAGYPAAIIGQMTAGAPVITCR
jgi:selenide,water dikinase